MARKSLVDEAMELFAKLSTSSQSRMRIKLKCKSTDCLGCIRTKIDAMSDPDVRDEIIDEMKAMEMKEDVLEEIN